MASKTVELKGQIIVGGDVCSDPFGAGSSKVQGLGLRCTGSSFQAVYSSDTPIDIMTAGAVGSAFIDVPGTEGLDRVELLMVRAQSRVIIRIGAAAATVLGVGGAFALGGGETLDFDVDGQSVSVLFTATTTAAQVANQINAAAALAGLTFLPASVDSSGQLRLTGVLTGEQGAVEVTGGTAAAGLGLANLSGEGQGEDVDVTGLFVAEFGKGSTSAPTRVQISGAAQIEVFAAGTPA